MPESHTNSRNVFALSTGANFLLGPLWVPDVLYAGWPALFFPAVQGIRFQIHTNMETEKPRTRGIQIALAADTFPPGPAAVLGETFVALQLTGNTRAFTDAPPVNLPPGDMAAGVPADWQIVGYDDGTGWSNPITPSILVLTLSPNTITDPVTGATIYDWSSLAYILEDCNANGILNMSIQVATGAVGINLFGILAVEELDFFTGVAGTKGREREDERVRIVRDSRYSMPSWSDELVENEYTKGLWVRAHDKDPEEEYREYVPNPREGVRDDDVPLE